jgi:3-hydroxyisobutyrate dehydrogenase-like beta-hydroxyacid dehydrogenase
VSTVGLLHPGEMGAALGAELTANGHSVLWASAGRSEATAERAAQSELDDVGTVEALAARSEVVLSICPPHAALEVARELQGYSGIYLDANAISPATARSVGGVVSRFVDGGVVGPPPVRAGTTRLYLSGAEADDVASLFLGTVVDVRILSAEIGSASALKMVYASWTKGSAALLLAVLATARAEGVDDALIREWSESQPELHRRSEAAARAAITKGWRWTGEMEEIADTFAVAGLPDGFHRAATEIYRRSAQAPAVSGADPLELILPLLRADA